MRLMGGVVNIFQKLRLTQNYISVFLLKNHCAYSRSQCRSLLPGVRRLASSDAAYHSKPLQFEHSDMKVKLIPALEDNYMYLLIDEASKKCAAVDPVEPKKVLAAVAEEGVTLACVLTTHHHWDHASGNEELLKLSPGIPVYGGDDRIGALSNKVAHNAEFQVGELNIKCLATPCHTTGHICYYVTGAGDDPLVFTGDTLFQGGCGRFFEGTPEQMYRALITILSALPDATRVYSGHEYSLNNLSYGLHVEPDNKATQDRMAWSRAQRAKNCPTVPSTIAEEKTFNPFMRVCEEPVKRHTKESDPIKVMGALRKEKDSFKPKM